MLSTAYTPGIESCGIWADGFTYTGDIVGKGCIAIDPNAGILKLGQKVFVEGYGYGICNDIGGAIIITTPRSYGNSFLNISSRHLSLQNNLPAVTLAISI
ncbi:unnamed protein product [marine sediment metagenome]|uniref:Uncharacterized protein n=1 Tax=marine sediment metagenome TaxID=412755 RepID=X1EL88_9ZZZZ